MGKWTEELVFVERGGRGRVGERASGARADRRRYPLRGGLRRRLPAGDLEVIDNSRTAPKIYGDEDVCFELEFKPVLVPSNVQKTTFQSFETQQPLDDLHEIFKFQISNFKSCNDFYI